MQIQSTTLNEFSSGYPIVQCPTGNPYPIVQCPNGNTYRIVQLGTYVKVVMVIELPAVLEPDDFGPGLARGYANEHNFVAQYVLVIEMRSLCYSCALKRSPIWPWPSFQPSLTN